MPESTSQSQNIATGTVYVEVEVSGRWAISRLTEHWTDDEKRKLAARDQEALDALIEEASCRVLRQPDEADDRYVEVVLNGERIKS